MGHGSLTSASSSGMATSSSTPNWPGLRRGLDANEETPTMFSAALERPALTADTAERRRELIEGALAVTADPPATPAPFAAPAPRPRNADEWAAHLELQLSCWDEAFGELTRACRETGPAADYLRYRTLTQALDWAHALDSSLGMLWRTLSGEERERASLETDERARKAAEHNAAGPLAFDVETDPAFAGYVCRSKDHQPYSHWGEVMLAGIFQAHFFRRGGVGARTIDPCRDVGPPGPSPVQARR